MRESLRAEPLTTENWDDFEKLFGPQGAYGGCWCMWWRKTRKQFEEDQGDANKAEMRAIVDGGTIPGIIVSRGQAPVGWCSIAPREDYASLERSPVLKRIDDKQVWSLVCLYIAKANRGEGVSAALVREAVSYAIGQGATIVEAYPTMPKSDPLPPVSSFMGLPHVFEQAGFEVCGQPSERKLFMRFTQKDSQRR